MAKEQNITTNTIEKEARYFAANRTVIERNIICLLKRRTVINLSVAKKITTEKTVVSMSNKLIALWKLTAA